MMLVLSLLGSFAVFSAHAQMDVIHISKSGDWYWSYSRSQGERSSSLEEVRDSAVNKVKTEYKEIKQKHPEWITKISEIEVSCDSSEKSHSCTASADLTYYPKQDFANPNCINNVWSRYQNLGSKIATQLCTANGQIQSDSVPAYSKCIQVKTEFALMETAILPLIEECIAEVGSNFREIAREQKAIADMEKEKSIPTFKYLNEDASIFSNLEGNLYIHLVQNKTSLDLKRKGSSPLALNSPIEKDNTNAGSVLVSISEKGCFEYVEIDETGIRLSDWKSLPGSTVELGCNVTKIEELKWLDRKNFSVRLIRNNQTQEFILRSNLMEPLSVLEEITQNQVLSPNEITLMPNILENSKTGDLFGFHCVSRDSNKNCIEVQAIYYSKKTRSYYPFGLIMNSQYISYLQFQKGWNWSNETKKINNSNFISALNRFRH